MTDRRASALSFLTAFVAFFAQILMHRMVSAKLLSNYAFLVVSLAMLGLATSGVLLSRWREAFFARREESIARAGALFGLTALGSGLVVYRLHTGSQFPLTPAESVAAMLKAMPLTLLIAVPFTFVGIILGILLSSRDLRPHRIYFFDLIGSALGAMLVLPVIPRVGVERALALSCAVMAVGTFALAGARTTASRGLTAASALVALVCALAPGSIFTIAYPPDSMLAFTPRIERIEWDALGRVELSVRPDIRYENFPCLMGRNPQFWRRINHQITHNNYAFTYTYDYDGTQQSLAGIEQTLYAAPYQAHATARPRVAVLGAGGGIDVVSALAFNAREVQAVEVNATVVRLLNGPYRQRYGRWLDDPRVSLVADDGRHAVAASRGRFDVIQLTSVESAAGAPSSANVFSEAYIYTRESFGLFLDKLTDQGILSVMHIEQPFPREMLRVLTIAVDALRARGVQDPSRHIVTLSSTRGDFVSILIKRTPFTFEELHSLEVYAQSPFFSMTASPAQNQSRQNVYQYFLTLGSRAREQRFIEGYPFDIRPPDDDRPFFFRASYWWHVWRPVAVTRGVLPQMEYSILVLLGLIGAAVLVSVVVPIRHWGRTLPAARRYGLYFAGIGIGYLFIEIAFLQKFGLLLGHPNYGMSVVLSGLLFASGLGSLASTALVSRVRHPRFLAYGLALILLAESALLFPLLSSLAASSIWLRGAVVVALLLPPGFLMGTFMPTALDQLKVEADHAMAWAWGVNGVFSVLAPVLAVAFSMTWGVNALMLTAIPVYLLAAMALPERTTPTP